MGVPAIGWSLRPPAFLASSGVHAAAFLLSSFCGASPSGRGAGEALIEHRRCDADASKSALHLSKSLAARGRTVHNDVGFHVIPLCFELRGVCPKPKDWFIPLVGNSSGMVLWGSARLSDSAARLGSRLGVRTRRLFTRTHKAIAKWSAIEVCDLLEDLGLRQYEPQFLAHNITGPVLLTISDRELEQQLGVKRDYDRCPPVPPCLFSCGQTQHQGRRRALCKGGVRRVRREGLTPQASSPCYLVSSAVTYAE